MFPVFVFCRTLPMMKLVNQNGLEKEAAWCIRRIIREHDSHQGALVICLRGELGAGKTTFIKAIARELGLVDTVSSPTFVIEKIYRIEKDPYSFLIHIDAYRLESCADLRHTGWDEAQKDAKNIICIEWADRVKDCMPPHAFWAALEAHDDPTMRSITYIHDTGEETKK